MNFVWFTDEKLFIVAAQATIETIAFSLLKGKTFSLSACCERDQPSASHWVTSLFDSLSLGQFAETLKYLP